MFVLQNICHPTLDDNHWLSNVESTQWLLHIKVGSLIFNIVRSCHSIVSVRTTAYIYFIEYDLLADSKLPADSIIILMDIC